MGKPVGWITARHVFDLKGSPVAFLNEDSLISYSGRHLGFFDRGLFRDHRGKVVAFLPGGKGGPALPVLETAPNPPAPARLPTLPGPPTPPTPPIPFLSWSKADWQQFIYP
jgi:hypothetical protein